MSHVAPFSFPISLILGKKTIRYFNLLKMQIQQQQNKKSNIKTLAGAGN